MHTRAVQKTKLYPILLCISSNVAPMAENPPKNVSGPTRPRCASTCHALIFEALIQVKCLKSPFLTSKRWNRFLKVKKSYINVLKGITLVKVSCLPDLAFSMSLRLGGKGAVASQHSS